MLTSLVYYSILLPTLPLAREICPTVVETCLDLSGGGNSYSGFLSTCRVMVEGGGEKLRGLLRTLVLKFFNRSPMTLKFGAEKIRERESRKREREREREQERERASCCCSTLVS